VEKRLIKISEIIIDESIYPRTSLCMETVERYREAIESGVKLPEIIITSDNRLLDGRHRLEAHKLAGIEEVEVFVTESADPDVDSVICNLKHGRPLAKEEIKAAARRWYGKMPVQQIAETLKVTRQTVQNWVADLVKEKEETREKIREKALEMRAEGLTQEEVAEKLGVPRQTISRWENKEYPSVKTLTHELKGNHDHQVRSSVKNLTHEQKEHQDDQECDHEKYLTPSRQQSLAADVNNQEATLEQVSSFDQEEESREDKTPGDEVTANIYSHNGHNTTLNDYGGREAAENYRKKHLEYSDQVKEFFNQLKKTSEIAEHLVNNREELYKTIAEMKSDGMSITVLASAVVQACDIYIPRINQARDILSELLKPGIKGVAVRDKFVVVNGGKGNDG